MKNNKSLIYSLVGLSVAVVVIAGAFFAVNGNKSDTKTNENSVASTTDAMKKDETTATDVMKKDETATTTVDAMHAGLYTDYDSAKVASASNDNKIILFFKASWCPTCNAFDKDVNANLTSIPKNVTILKIDYDNSTDLKKKYGITYQHTFVEVDKDGNQLKKWSGSLTLNDFIGQIV